MAAATFNLSSSSSKPLSSSRVSNNFKLFNDFPPARLNYKFASTHNAAFRVKAALVTGGGSGLAVDELKRTSTQDSLKPTFFQLDNNEFDLDSPAEGFASIPEAIEDIRQGKMVVVVDDEDRENEGDLIMAAQLATPEALAFIVKHGTGIVCVSMKEEDLDRLELPDMTCEN